MDIIKQTNRKILFDEVNPEKLDLLTIIGGVQSVTNLDDAKINEINENLTEINLDIGNCFFKVLCTLVDARKNQGNKNVDFKFENILDMLSPKKVMDDIKQLRKEISYLYDKHEELEEEKPAKLELGDKLNFAFEKASRNYNNVLGMLPFVIEDIKTRALLGHSEGEVEEIKLGVLSMGYYKFLNQQL